MSVVVKIGGKKYRSGKWRVFYCYIYIHLRIEYRWPCSYCMLFLFVFILRVSLLSIQSKIWHGFTCDRFLLPITSKTPIHEPPFVPRRNHGYFVFWDYVNALFRAWVAFWVFFLHSVMIDSHLSVLCFSFDFCFLQFWLLL